MSDPDTALPSLFEFHETTNTSDTVALGDCTDSPLDVTLANDRSNVFPLTSSRDLNLVSDLSSPGGLALSFVLGSDFPSGARATATLDRGTPQPIPCTFDPVTTGTIAITVTLPGDQKITWDPKIKVIRPSAD